MSNYSDDVRNYDNNPGSPFYNEPPPQCPHCKEACSEDDLCPNCDKHTIKISCINCKSDFTPETEFEFENDICESCIVDNDIEEVSDLNKLLSKQ
jgi:hypothetical protein